ncbi:MAG: hypothetical protein R3232_07075 [Clostridia bacterium]|nr:hypothetical protein [Clostridia bacterium]
MCGFGQQNRQSNKKGKHTNMENNPKIIPVISPMKVKPMELYRALEDKFGKDSSRLKLIEEISELMNDLSQLQMMLIHNKEGWTHSINDSICNTLAEMADVMVTSERYMMHASALEYASMVYEMKIERTWSRLQNGELD